MHIQQARRVQRVEVAVGDLPVQHARRLLGEVALVQVVDPDPQHRRLERDGQEQ
jgi:hypothetical protein